MVRLRSGGGGYFRGRRRWWGNVWNNLIPLLFRWLLRIDGFGIYTNIMVTQSVVLMIN